METLVIEISKEANKLKMSVYEKGRATEHRHYSEKVISDKEIEEICGDITEIFNKANKHGELADNYSDELRKNTQLLYDQLLTTEVKGVIRDKKAKFLIFSIDEQLVQIPWELLHDGANFICLRFAIGRGVRTKQRFYDVKYRSLSSPLRMLALCDPTGDLKSAYEEGIVIRNELDKKKDKIKVDLKTTEIDVRYVKKNIRDYDILHFAGHAEYNLKNPSQSGWILLDGKFTPEDITELGLSASFPSLIFSNACQSGKTEEWKIEQGYEDKIYGLANAFLLAGVRHYIGTFWRVLDESCLLFSREFYKHIANGVSIGEALRLSRVKLIEKYGESSIIWSSYMLYGDPSISMFVSPPKKEPSLVISDRKKILITAGTIILVLIGLISYTRFAAHKPTIGITKLITPITEENIIAVLPFENLSVDKEKDIGSGIAEVIITKLSSIEQIKLIDRSQLPKIWDEIKVTKGIDKNTRRKIGNILGAKTLIIGAYQKVNDNIRITARLVNSNNGEILATTETIGLYKDIFELQDIIAFNVLAKLNIKITEKEKDKIKEAKLTENISAFEYFARANEYFIKNDYENAIKLCKKALELDPEFIQAVSQLGQLYERMKEWELAKSYYRRSKDLAENQQDKNMLLNAYFHFGRIIGIMGDYEKALEYEQKALDIANEINSQQSYATILAYMGPLYIELNQGEKALEVALESKKIFEKSNNIAALGDVYLKLGHIYRFGKDFDRKKGIEYYDKASEIYESINYKYGLLMVYPTLASLYSYVGDDNKSAKYFNKGLQIAKELGDRVAESSIYIQLAYSYAMRKEYGDAEEYYKRALTISEEVGGQAYINSLTGLADFYSLQLQYEKAIACTKQLEEYSAEVQDYNALILAKRKIANAYKSMGDYKKALKGFKEALSYKEKISDKYNLAIINLGIATCYSRMGDEKKAERFINDAIQVAKEYRKALEAHVLIDIGELYKDQNDFDSAIAYYNKAIAILNDIGLHDLNITHFISSYYGIANCYNAKKDYKKAKEYYEKALPLAVKTSNPLIPIIKSKIYYLGVEEKEKKIVSKEAKVLYDKAMMEVNRGNLGIALGNILKAEKIEPKNRKIMGLTSLIYGYQGRHKEAIDTHLRYIKLLDQKDEAEEIAEQYITIGYYYFQMGKSGESLRYYKKGLSIGEKINSDKILAQAYAELSMVYESLSQDDEAIQYAQKAIGIGDKIKQVSALSNAYWTLSVIYGRKGDKEKELEYAQKHLKLNEESGSVELGQSYALLGMLYEERDILKSIDYLNKAIDFFKKHHDRPRSGNIYHQLGGIYSEMSQYDKALEYYLDSLLISEELNDKWTTSANYLGLSSVYNKIGKEKLAQKYEQKLIELTKEIGTEEELGICYSVLAHSKKDPEKAKEYYKLSLEILEKYKNDKNISTIILNYRALCAISDSEKKYDEAIIYCNKALNLANQHNLKTEALRATIFIALAYGNKKDWDNALDWYKKALVLAKELDDKSMVDPVKGEIERISSYLDSINVDEETKAAANLVLNAYFYGMQGKDKLALANCNKALDIFKKKNDKEKIAGTLSTIAIIYLSKDNFSLANKYINESMVIFKEIDNKESLGLMHGARGILLEKQDNYKEAEREYNIAMEQIRDSEKEYKYKSAYYSCLGTIYYKRHNYKISLEHYKKALEIGKKDADPRIECLVHTLMGHIYFKDNQYANALSSLEESLRIAEQIDDKVAIVIGNIIIGKIQMANNNQEAEKYFKKAVEQAELLEDSKIKLIAYGNISLFYKINNKIREYNRYLKLAKQEDAPGCIKGDKIDKEELGSLFESAIEEKDYFTRLWM